MIVQPSPRRLVLVWAVLVAATCVSWALGAHHGAGSGAVRAGTAIALAIAFVKVHLVGSEFMELRGAPVALRAVFTGWLVVVGASLVGIYVGG